ncbi:hypothetical protein [Armatimonas sp.]
MAIFVGFAFDEVQVDFATGRELLKERRGAVGDLESANRAIVALEGEQVL